MNLRVEQSVNIIADTVFAWPCVDAVTIMDSELDSNDPYFQVSLDVYFVGELPSETVRVPAFSYAGAFESNPARQKDRFIIDTIPFRIEYKSLERIDTLLRGSPGMREDILYTLFRLQQARVLRFRSDWIHDSRMSLNTLDQHFWDQQGLIHLNRLEHSLQDMRNGLLKDDKLYFHLSLSAYLESLCSLLFSLNHRFRPAPRFLSAEILKLEILPQGFASMFQAMVCPEEYSRSRIVSLAVNIARWALALF